MDAPDLRNPLPLSAAQEAQVLELYHKKVRAKCADEIREFASCAFGKTVSAAWNCRTKRLRMNSCIARNATVEELDGARNDWIESFTSTKKQNA